MPTEKVNSPRTSRSLDRFGTRLFFVEAGVICVVVAAAITSAAVIFVEAAHGVGINEADVAIYAAEAGGLLVGALVMFAGIAHARAFAHRIAHTGPGD